MKVDLNNSKDIFKHFDLEENSVYLVIVKCNSSNPEHKSILFTGFENGNYCMVYNNSYNNPIPMSDIYSMKVIKKLTSIE